MPELTVPKGNRIHIAFFGLRNAGKSTLVNAFTGQTLAIVSERPGTTTDPVSKAMEILPLGPCLITDTAGLDDDEGELGSARVAKSLAVLENTDIAIWVSDGTPESALRANTPITQIFRTRIKEAEIPVLEFTRGDDINALKEHIGNLTLDDAPPPLVADLITPGDCIIAVCPIDAAAPKGRLILPQQQVIREIIEARGCVLVCQPSELPELLKKAPTLKFVITDSQAFEHVAACVPHTIPITSFSIVFARVKGDLTTYVQSAQMLTQLKDNDLVAITEGCTHKRQCGDIGSVKLPRWIERFTKRKLRFKFYSGNDFPTFDTQDKPALIVQCGGCMMTRRQVQTRIKHCYQAHIPITNYGICIATCHGIKIDAHTRMVCRETNSR